MKTNIPFTLRGAAFLLTASLAATLAAQTRDTSVPPTSSAPAPLVPMADNSKVAHHDKSFLEKAEKAGRKEVAVSQAVAGRVVNPQVRDFATMMVTDHTAANREIMTLAMAKGVTLEEPSDMKLAEKWSEKGGDLDKKYLKEMIEDHEDAVKLFEKAAKSDDADISAFAQKTLPTLKHHLMTAQDLKKNLAM